MNKKQFTTLLLTSLLLVGSIPSVSAFCFLGFLGNTCGDDSSTPKENGGLFETIGNRFSRGFNFDTPKTEGSGSSREIRDDYNDGDFSGGKTYDIYEDVDGEVDINVESPYRFSVTQTSSEFYDVDIKDITIECVNCAATNEGVIESAGFLYVVKIYLFNHGTAPAEAVDLRVVVEETGNKKEFLLSGSRSLYLPPADYVVEITLKDIVGFNTATGELYSEAFYDGRGSRTFPISIEAQVYNDDEVVSLGKKIVRSTSSEGRISSRTFYICPDGEQLTSNRPSSCEFEDPDQQDQQSFTKELARLTPELIATGDLDI